MLCSDIGGAVTFLSLCVTVFSMPPPQLVRLVGGSDPRAGIVEVYHNGSWGYLCGGAIDTRDDASVTCRQLGYPDAIPITISGWIFEWVEKPFVLDKVTCTGDEAALQDCPNSGWRDYIPPFYKCYKNWASTLWCAPEVPKVRLVGGRGGWEGNVEVHSLGKWGYICNPSYNIDIERMTKQAQVICGQLGFNREDAYPLFDNFFDVVDESDYVIVPNFLCDGTEDSLMDCDYNGFIDDLKCYHRHAFAVSCKKEPVKLRLVDGESETRGRLEVYGYGKKSPVCGYLFNEDEATVACRELGIDPQGTKPAVLPSHRFFRSTLERTRLSGVDCHGDEETYQKCYNVLFGRIPRIRHDDIIEGCGERDQIGIDCRPDPIQVRLVDGPNERSGRVEVYYAGVWGTICGKDFEKIHAEIVCSTLGFGTENTIAYQASPYGTGSLALVMQIALDCDPSDLRFERCQMIWDSAGPLCADWNDNDSMFVAAVACGEVENVIV
ncbi:unnamed protein product [Owenia fusiformis]|uniref:SRCR domain-containing protein n=1 Tax=Owenia fusiformis TaxID=6347 RepID=A0A8S4PN61_OWEFU|nr:unnamed protein product [Owenia fusiformis]